MTSVRLKLADCTLYHVVCARAVADVSDYHLGVTDGFAEPFIGHGLLPGLLKQRQQRVQVLQLRQVARTHGVQGCIQL